MTDHFVTASDIKYDYTANRVGQNLSTFAQRWFKYQQSKLLGQFDPTMGTN